MLTDVPATPEFGFTWAMDGVGMMVKGVVPLAYPLLYTPTETFPVTVLAGTTADREVWFWPVAVTKEELKDTCTKSALLPRFVPVIVTTVPAAPEVGEIPVMVGVASTLNFTPLLGTLFTVTTTGPEEAPAGTG